MTQEEKAKRYDEAITKARNIVNSINVGLIGKDSFEAVFPELKESEDEKVREEIISFIKDNTLTYTENGAKSQIRWVAWLEKQKDKEWSEEDEKGRGDALWCCKQAASIAKDENDMGNCWYAEKWLKSLRPQSHWKPSEEQIIALRWVLNNIPYNKHKEEISGLLDQIKEL